MRERSTAAPSANAVKHLLVRNGRRHWRPFSLIKPTQSHSDGLQLARLPDPWLQRRACQRIAVRAPERLCVAVFPLLSVTVSVTVNSPSPLNTPRTNVPV